MIRVSFRIKVFNSDQIMNYLAQVTHRHPEPPQADVIRHAATFES